MNVVREKDRNRASTGVKRGAHLGVKKRNEDRDKAFENMKRRLRAHGTQQSTKYLKSSARNAAVASPYHNVIANRGRVADLRHQKRNASSPANGIAAN